MRKTSWLRRRFIKSEVLLGPMSWSDAGSELRQNIIMDSAYQLVGNKIILSVSRLAEESYILIEVLGIPKVGLSFIDLEASSSLIYNFPESAFDVDFLTVKKRGEEIFKAVSYNLEDNYHIVLEGKNLALHFFIQKDYIQS